ncbi:hypothetical protein M405DRAFT_833143, partial [Rhizopogon salebrosus TDB-379]
IPQIFSTATYAFPVSSAQHAKYHQTICAPTARTIVRCCTHLQDLPNKRSSSGCVTNTNLSFMVNHLFLLVLEKDVA